MALSINTRSFTVDQTGQNAVVYRDPNATFVLPSVARLGRTAPKPTATFAGVTRSEGKLSKTVDIGDGKTSSVIMRAETSVPVQASEAAVDASIADFRSFVASTAFADLVKKGMIYYA